MSVSHKWIYLTSAALVVGATAAAWVWLNDVKLHQTRSAGVARCQAPDASEVRIPGGTFLMGAGDASDSDVTVREVAMQPFSIDRYVVTNAAFDTFVKATAYVTEAENPPNPADYPDVRPEDLTAGGAVFVPPSAMPDMQSEAAWWAFVPGASWRHPDGPSSSIDGKENYPVVQVTYNDALAYARWRGRDLPTEEEFEYAARGGLDKKIYAWGDELTPDGKQMANTWQGEGFPVSDAGQDGFSGLAPAGCFPANGYGLYDMIGNVWEWTASRYYTDEAEIPAARAVRVIKGGSYLCSSTFCRRYRPAARQGQEGNFSSVHLGFRTVARSDE